MQTSVAFLSALLLAVLPRGCEPPPSDAPNPISWQTPSVSLTADDFWIEVDGERFTGRGTVLQPRSDPGWNHYTTLELQWTEHGREMRLFIYFKADGAHWWSEEIRTRDGREHAEWIYYYGTHFRSPLGQPFTGDIHLPNNGPGDPVRGSIHFQGLRLLPTFNNIPGPF